MEEQTYQQAMQNRFDHLTNEIENMIATCAHFLADGKTVAEATAGIEDPRKRGIVARFLLNLSIQAALHTSCKMLEGSLTEEQLKEMVAYLDTMLM